MNREIKYKAWHKEHKIMFDVKTLYIKGNPKEAIWINENTSRNKEYGYVGEDINLLEFIGLKDNNGKEIYTDYVIKYKGANGYVIYDESIAMFMVEFPTLRSIYSFDSMDESFEVVGNIHENPELLKI